MIRLFLLRWLIWFLLLTNSARAVETENLTEVPATTPQIPNEIVLEVEEPDKPARVAARLEGDVSDYWIQNTYDIDYLSRDVVGQVGVPIEVYSYIASDPSDELTLVFQYDPTMLECEETDLRVLWYNEEDYWYETLTEYELDAEKNEISVPVRNMGTYVLEDIVIWISVWDGTYEYEDVMMEPDCHWHEEFTYEDIEALADTSLYDGSGEYHITTVEQLAGLVKLVNEGESFYGCNFYLDADLDLAGYDWAPIGWYYPADNGYLWRDFPFEGRFYGNGHTIYNMSIIAPDQSNLGMFGRTLQAFSIHDFSLVDCYIEGQFYVGGILGDNINRGDSFDMTNCHVTGTVKGRMNVGALVGSSARLRLQDCTAVMKDGSTDMLVGDLRSGYMENCTIEME